MFPPSNCHMNSPPCSLLSLPQALKALFTSRSTGIGRKGRWLTAEDLEAYLYVMSQPGALTGALNYYRNVFRWGWCTHTEIRPINFYIHISGRD